ncbi:MAG: Phospholipid methyltransferase [Bacteroidetes bacterium]|jgi:protein-S-isoprenylcysteine O-methyltransferase Ste14|nr:Phospholipid methyltransferase [Bacteroidota bacterium]
MDKTAIRLIGAAAVAALVLAASSLNQLQRLVLSLVLGLPSLVLLIVSRRQLGTSFTKMPEARKLVTSGLYSKIQHPMYVFLDLFLAALILALGLPYLLIIWALFVAVQMTQARREEKVLAAAFGSADRTYRSQTWL